MFDAKENLEKSFKLMETSVQKMWDMWLASMGNLTTTQEKIENMTRKQLDQSKAARDELIKLEEDLSQRMRQNQEQFQKMVENAVVSTYDQVNKANQQMISDLSKQVDDLNKKIKKNQDQVQKMVQEAVMTTFEQGNKANQDLMVSLSAQVKEMSDKILSLGQQYQNLAAPEGGPKKTGKK